MNELQAAIAELENQRNFFQIRCIQMAQEIAGKEAAFNALTEELNKAMDKDKPEKLRAVPPA